MSITNSNNRTYGVDKILFITGIISIILAYFIYEKAKIEFEPQEMTRGYIAKYINNSDGRKIPVIGFETLGNESRTFIDRNPLLSTAQKKEMFIVYNPNNLAEVIVYDEFESKKLPASIAVIGGVLLAFGFVVFRVRNRG
jgi:hypothetical protein